MAIVSWKHKGLKDFFNTGTTKGIQADHKGKLGRILAILSSATHEDELRIPGFGLHPLNPKESKIHAVTVNGNWRVTFRFNDDGNAEIVNYLDYH